MTKHYLCAHSHTVVVMTKFAFCAFAYRGRSHDRRLAHRVTTRTFIQLRRNGRRQVKISSALNRLALEIPLDL